MIDADFLHETRTSYDAIAADYAVFARDEIAKKHLDRAMIGAFADLVRGAGQVADIGCGTGNATGYLNELGIDVFGIDLSPGMLAVARERLPNLRFEEGSMLALDLPDASLAGLVAWYSTIHVPDELLPQAFAEFHRVLEPGGHALLAFQIGDEPLPMTEGLGHQISLVFHRRRPEQVAELLEKAGLTTHAQLVREPEGERTRQAFLIARK